MLLLLFLMAGFGVVTMPEYYYTKNYPLSGIPIVVPNTQGIAQSGG